MLDSMTHVCRLLGLFQNLFGKRTVTVHNCLFSRLALESFCGGECTLLSLLIKPNSFPQTGTLYFGAANNLTDVGLANILIKLNKEALVCIYRVCGAASIMEEIFVCVRSDSEPELGMLI